jgi:hypothetical protein
MINVDSSVLNTTLTVHDTLLKTDELVGFNVSDPFNYPRRAV